MPVKQLLEVPLDIRLGLPNLSHLGGDVLGAVYMKDREILVGKILMAAIPESKFLRQSGSSGVDSPLSGAL